MKRYISALLSTMAVTLIVGGMTVSAQEKSRPAAKGNSTSKESRATESAKVETGSKSTAKEVAPKTTSVTRRLPAGFSSLNLTDEQKDEIHRIRDANAQQVQDLEKQIQKLRAQLEKDFNAVLTSSQKKMLASQKAAKQEATSTEQAETAAKKPAAKTTRKVSTAKDADEAADTASAKPSAKKKT